MDGLLSQQLATYLSLLHFSGGASTSYLQTPSLSYPQWRKCEHAQATSLSPRTYMYTYTLGSLLVFVTCHLCRICSGRSWLKIPRYEGQLYGSCYFRSPFPNLLRSTIYCSSKLAVHDHSTFSPFSFVPLYRLYCLETRYS